MQIIRFLLTVVFIVYSSLAFAHELRSFAPIVKKTLPAVVSIRTKTRASDRRGLLDNMRVPKEMEKFLEDFFDEYQRNSKPNVSQGSGFIFDKKGYVLTNNHVIYRATTVEVIMQDGTIYQADVKGTDPKTDIAVLQLKNFKKPLPVINFGDSDKAQVGDWVIAIGNPLGLGGSVTKGIISARSRNIQSGLYDDYIQTDTPINRGNSGGPLIDIDGNVVGVNTAIISPTGGSIGLGFAISANLVKDIAIQLVEKGSVKRAWLGVGLQSVTAEIADSLNLKKTEGVIITAVQKDSPADKGGIKVGDVILSVDDKTINKTQRLPILIARAPIDVPVKFKIIRAGKVKKLKIKLVKRDEDSTFIGKSYGSRTVELAKIGISISKLDGYLRDKYKFKANQRGVVIVNVDKLSSAYRVLREGLIISQINSVDIKSLQNAEKVVALAIKQNKKNILLIVKNNKGVQKLITLPIR